MSIAEKITLLRTEKGYSSSKCCKEMGLTASTLHSVEKENCKPGAELIIKICKYFNVSSDWLLGLKDERN